MTLTDITQIRVLPMHSLNVALSAGETFFLTNPESDSTWEWTEIKQPNAAGGSECVGYKLSITWIIPYGHLQTQTELHRMLAQRTINFVSLELKAIDGQQQGAHLTVGSNSTAPATVEHWSYELVINKAELRPRTELRLRGLFSIDALGVAPNPNFFNQLSGF